DYFCDSWDSSGAHPLF
nr:immunoglobulin light chain junction region [Macaca mulatta]MOW14964.1 immunoglobulin light chain junction region [Macaca mulatta]MOW14990.1 immunoglobulin light chain junction region [Macaca mulatta]MOW15110.1 immunoglobulin light chain junction region [Macaca mulatta]MOW15177.1 immunoglobulin light chain junction region [Macaca mulatta]